MRSRNHPARRARQIAAVATGAAYLGVTGAIVAAAGLASRADSTELETTSDVDNNAPEGVALELAGSAEAVRQPSTSVGGVDPFGGLTTVDGGGLTPRDPSTTSSSVPNSQTVGSAVQTTQRATSSTSPTTSPISTTTVAPTTTTTSASSSSSTLPPSSSSSTSSTSSTSIETTTTASTSTTSTTVSTTTTTAPTTTTSGAS